MFLKYLLTRPATIVLLLINSGYVFFYSSLQNGYLYFLNMHVVMKCVLWKSKLNVLYECIRCVSMTEM